MNIYVTRHGITPLNKQKKVNGEVDEPLAEEGIKQAQEMATSIPKSVKYIFSSPLIRATQTANIINSIANLSLSVRSELTEIKMGSLAGLAWEEMESGAELKQKHRTVQFDYTSFGGEDVAGVKKRLLNILSEINDKHKDSEVLIITHGGIIRVLQMLEKNEPLYETEKNVSLLTFNLERILNSSI